jgi:phosphoglycerol geranylgeranyltransferase
MKSQSGFIYSRMLSSFNCKKRLLAVLLDPEDFEMANASHIIGQIHHSPVTHIFVGGSTVRPGAAQRLIKLLKQLTALPVLIFPGDENQITPAADALLFLTLLSGRNPEYLIETQIRSAAILREQPMETISTGYILIEGGLETTVQRVSKTKPIPMNQINHISNTALAGELLGNKLIYLETGSGAKLPVAEEVIKQVKKNISIPLIVGGGIRSADAVNKAYSAGADMLVIGTAFEKDFTFFESLNHLKIS